MAHRILTDVWFAKGSLLPTTPNAPIFYSKLVPIYSIDTVTTTSAVIIKSGNIVCLESPPPGISPAFSEEVNIAQLIRSELRSFKYGTAPLKPFLKICAYFHKNVMFTLTTNSIYITRVFTNQSLISYTSLSFSFHDSCVDDKYNDRVEWQSCITTQFNELLTMRTHRHQPYNPTGMITTAYALLSA